MKFKLGIIGGGNMGHAIVRGAVEHEVIPADRILVCDVDAAKRAALGSLDCVTTDDPRVVPAHLAEDGQLLLAVKPQIFPEVAQCIAPLEASRVVISIMAGLSSAHIRATLGENARMVRVMPNMPCQVGAGMSAIALGQGANEGDDELAHAVFASIGETVQVREAQMNAVTAVSGSGPGYFFFLAQAMQEAAVSLGLEPKLAELLVNQTIRGSGRLLLESDHSAEALRLAVANPGGTTEAALDVMNKQQIPRIITEALTAARDRGLELDQDD